MRRPGARRALLATTAALALAGCAGLGLPELPGLGGAPPLWEQPPPAPRDHPVVPEGRLHRTRLANGLEVLVLEDHGLPWIEMGVTARRGVGIERPEEAGLAALTAEVMQRGAGERGALELARMVDDLGASFGVSAGWDATSVRLAGLSRDRDALFEVLADVTRRPRFESMEVERARAEQQAALDKAREDASTLAAWWLDEVLYPGHRYRLPAGGTPESVAALDADALRAFHRRVFVPGNVVVHAVGDVDAEAFLAAVREAFGSWEEGPVPEPAAPPRAPAPPERRIVVVDRPDLGQTQLRLGHDGIARDDEARIPAQLVNTILGGGGFNSRLMQTVRADAGLTYGIGSGFDQRRRPGPFQVGTFTRNAEVGRVVRLVLDEIEALRTTPIPPDELDAARSLRSGRFALALETAAAVAESLVDLDVYGMPAELLDTYRTRLRAVSTAEAEAVARALLHPDRMAIVAVGPAEELVPQLEPLGPVEVVQP